MVVAFTALLYTIICNTKKYELTYQYYQDENSKKTYLAELSALIETGTFYFPNIDQHDNFGAAKPLSYRGYKNVVWNFLVYQCQLFD